MKTSDKLYNLNRQISLLHIAKELPMEYESICTINEILAEAIKEIREMEDRLEAHGDNIDLYRSHDAKPSNNY